MKLQIDSYYGNYVFEESLDFGIYSIFCCVISNYYVEQEVGLTEQDEIRLFGR